MEKNLYKNIHIYGIDGKYVVRADSKQYGKQAVVFETYSFKQCWEWFSDNYRSKSSKITTKVFSQAMRTCNMPNNPWYKPPEHEAAETAVYLAEKVS